MAIAVSEIGSSPYLRLWIEWRRRTITSSKPEHSLTRDAIVRLQQIVDGGVVSPRLYLLDATKENYEITKFTGAEFAFDVDATKLPCGMNSALYLSEMATDGGRSELNTGGATWGTGYCDAQCYVTPFINGEVSQTKQTFSPPLIHTRLTLTLQLQGNVDGYGACCNEVDIWEANSRSNHIAPHPCSIEGPYNCEGAECEADGVCDKNGCSWNPYRIGQPDYYGTSADFDVDTTRPFTVVTQFPADGEGQLTAINRLYVQDGAVIRAEVVNKEGLPPQDHMDDAFCEATGSTAFMRLGAMAGMGAAMSRGMVLTFSIWWDDGGNMSWLDGEADGAGPCNATEGNPTNIVKVEPAPEVTFSNIRWGEINSTFTAPPANRTVGFRAPSRARLF